MSLKLKNNEVTTKVRVCVDGIKQRNWISKENTSSATVSNKGIMFSCMIDAMEGRDIATTEILGAFLQNN